MAEALPAVTWLQTTVREFRPCDVAAASAVLLAVLSACFHSSLGILVLSLADFEAIGNVVDLTRSFGLVI